MAKQNLQSWFWDIGLPSPQVASSLVKATSPFPTNTRLPSIDFSSGKQPNLSWVPALVCFFRLAILKLPSPTPHCYTVQQTDRFSQ